MQHVIAIAIMLGGALLASPTFGKELIGEFSGDRSSQTPEFEVEAPWILDWRVTGQYVRDMAVDVSLVEAKTNVHQGGVLKARAPGTGLRLFKEGGRFYFRVDSTLSGWNLKVEQLTEAEAELYTPKNPSRLDY